jgi:phosphate butyryltransferase
MIEHVSQLIEKAKTQNSMRLAVVSAEEAEVLKAVNEAVENGLVEGILFGEIAAMKEIAENLGINLAAFKVVKANSMEEAASLAVQYVREGKADFIMKGLVDTSIFLKAVLNREKSLRTGNLLSHVMVYEIPTYHKLLLLTDGGMNLAPDLDKKGQILQNSVDVARALENESIKVACLAAKEKVNPKMQATVDADRLKQRGIAGDFGQDVIVEGPMALDLAVSERAAGIKKYQSPVAGQADILLVPSIEMGNGIGKAITYFAQGRSAGIVMGATVPVVLTSRADSHEDKLNSIALGSVIAGWIKQGGRK